MKYDINNVDITTVGEKVASALLKIQAVFLKPQDPFTWASGIKSPIYCDNRLTLSDPAIRHIIEESLATYVKKYFAEAEVVMGTSTAGIPHAAIVSEILDLPMGYVRGSAKAHGRNNQIEGANPAGKKVVVIEDLISTGGSSIEVVETLRESGADVLGIVSIFTYTLKKGLQRLQDANVINHSLSDINALTTVAVNSGYITKEERDMVLKFISNPQDESWMA